MPATYGISPATHHTAVVPAGHGHLAICSCGWRAAFPSFSEHVAGRQSARHYAKTGGAA